MNISDIIKKDVNIEPIEDNIEEDKIEENQIIEENVKVNYQYIKLISLSEWFQKYKSKHNINKIRLDTIRNIDVDYYMLFITTSEDSSRKLFLYEDVQKYRALDFEPIDFQVFSTSSYRIIYRIDDKTIIKLYSFFGTLHIYTCNIIDGRILPYHKLLVKKPFKYPDLRINIGDYENKFRGKFNEEIEISDFYIEYPILKSKRKKVKIKTKLELIEYFFERQNGVIDNKHHIKIEDIILSLFI